MMKAGIVLLALCTATLAPAFAQPPDHHRGPGSMRERHEGIMDQLNLTDTQKDQMRKLRLELAKKQATLQSKIKMARLDMAELFLADKPDRAAIEKQIKTVSDLQYQEKVNRLDHMFAVKDILTPEQQKMMKQHMRDGGGLRRWRERGEMDMRDHMDMHDQGMLLEDGEGDDVR